MNKQTRADLFLYLWEHWRKHFKMPPLETRKDLRYHCHACVESWEEADEHHEKGYRELVYNPRKLAKWSTPIVINGVFHELAHYKNDLPYDTFEEQVKSEYKAERFAVTMMKRYYPTELKEVIKHVKTKNLGKKKWRKAWPIHTAAYLKIKEYFMTRK